MQFRILGPLEVLDGQCPVELGRPKQRAVLAVLLVHANQVVTLDRLIEELWGEQPPAQATASLQAYISNCAGPWSPSGRRGRPRGCWSPSPRLPAGGRSREPGRRPLHGAGRAGPSAAGGRAVGAGRPGTPGGAGAAAWPPLADMADEPCTQAERQRLEELRLAALEDRLAAELALGGACAAVAELGELVGRFPFRERLHGLLMLRCTGPAGRGAAGVPGRASYAGRGAGDRPGPVAAHAGGRHAAAGARA